MNVKLTKQRYNFDNAPRVISSAHVVPVITYNSLERPYWYVMPRAKESAAAYLRRSSGVNALWLFRHTCAGIAHAHEQGVHHRDIKPGNILLFEIEDSLQAAVSDFGMGRFLIRDTPPLTASNAGFGTPNYMSPEQAAGSRDIDHRTDVFSLGVLLYELLTGNPLTPTSLFNQPPPSPYDEIVQKAIDSNPDRRFQSVTKLLDSLP